MLAAYSATAVPGVGGLHQEAANDDLAQDGSTRASQIRFAPVQGMRYFIAVDGFAQATGDIKLT